ncbi:response regulator transcription factor [Alkalihalobacillus clausii]|nr:response regulator transcription factor [Shouchella clausii]
MLCWENVIPFHLEEKSFKLKYKRLAKGGVEMKRIIVCDRDLSECYGMEWLIRSSHLQVERAGIACSPEELFEQMETERPDVICLELDMFQGREWEQLKHYTAIFTPALVAVSAEGTYAKAMQALELGCVDLLIKPLDSEKLLRHLHKLLREKHSVVQSEKEEPEWPCPSYRDLFLPGRTDSFSGDVVLIQHEEKRKTVKLLEFAEAFPFTDKPAILPLSDVVILVFPDRDPWREKLCHKLLNSWGDENNGLAVFVLDQKENRTLQEAYQRALLHLQRAFFIGFDQVIVTGEAFSWERIDPLLTPEEQRIWIEMLRENKLTSLKQWLYGEFYYASGALPDPRLLRIKLTSILAQVRRYMRNWKMAGEDVERAYYNLFNSVLNMPVLARIVQELILFIQFLFEQTRRVETVQKTDVVHEALRYMNKHYQNPKLNLTRVAEHVGRNPSYLSQLFSIRLKQSFRHALQDIRIAAAKELLADPMLAIGEIAERVGYANPAYFSKAFKKQTAYSPNQYRIRELTTEKD